MQFSVDELADAEAHDPEVLEEAALKVASRRGGWDSGLQPEKSATIEIGFRHYTAPTFAPTNAKEWLAAMTLDVYGPRLNACGLRSLYAFQALSLKPLFTDLDDITGQSLSEKKTICMVKNAMYPLHDRTGADGDSDYGVQAAQPAQVSLYITGQDAWEWVKMGGSALEEDDEGLITGKEVVEPDTTSMNMEFLTASLVADIANAMGIKKDKIGGAVITQRALIGRFKSDIQLDFEVLPGAMIVKTPRRSPTCTATSSRPRGTSGTQTRRNKGSGQRSTPCWRGARKFVGPAWRWNWPR